MGIQVGSKQYWERAVTEVEIRAARLLGVQDTEAAKVATEKFNINYAPSIWDWSSHRTIHVHPGPRSREEREEERADRAKWVGAGASLGAALLAGLFLSSFSRAREELNVTSERIEGAKTLHKTIKHFLKDLFSEQQKIDERNYAAARDKLASAVIILAGGVMTATGGFMVASALMTAGYATMLFGGIGLLFSIGLHWSDEKGNRENAYEILGFQVEEGRGHRGLAESARCMLCKYDDQMQRIDSLEEPGEYVPLYEEGELPTYGRPSAPEQVEGEGAPSTQ